MSPEPENIGTERLNVEQFFTTENSAQFDDGQIFSEESDLQTIDDFSSIPERLPEGNDHNDTPANVFCHKCGAKMNYDDVFCFRCGARNVELYPEQDISQKPIGIKQFIGDISKAVKPRVSAEISKVSRDNLL